MDDSSIRSYGMDGVEMDVFARIVVTTMVVIVILIVMRVVVSTMTIVIGCCDVRHELCELDSYVGVCC